MNIDRNIDNLLEDLLYESRGDAWRDIKRDYANSGLREFPAAVKQLRKTLARYVALNDHRDVEFDFEKVTVFLKDGEDPMKHGWTNLSMIGFKKLLARDMEDYDVQITVLTTEDRKTGMITSITCKLSTSDSFGITFF